MWGLRLRLYAHALLRESRIFPGIDLYDDSPDYKPLGFVDSWKGNYDGEPVCVKVIRTRDPIRIKEIQRVGDCSISSEVTQGSSHQVFRRVIEGNNPNPHPNVLPVIEVSETLFPFCIMTPWMPDGNIIQFTQANPGANRLTLVRA